MTNGMKIQLLSTLLLCMLGELLMSTMTIAASNSRLVVAVNGLKNQKGVVCFSLFASEQGFPNRSDQAIASSCIPAQEASISTTFDQLAPGRYAVAVIHDANADGKLNTGFLGIPKEGFGFSRNPRIGTGAPSFNSSAVLVSGQNTQIQIDLKYLR
jgi:uncharacterized protein (DUF2141 family)